LKYFKIEIAEFKQAYSIPNNQPDEQKQFNLKMMKRNNSTNGKTQVKSNTLPTCAFCKGAGEPIKVYTSHWQFSHPVNGKLTCPKLLNYCCTNCHTNGHIEKRCPFPKAKAAATATKTSLYCKFCDNARKADYATHNQFDKDGFVQCPVLLNIECQQCGAKGHTKRYCLTQTQPASHAKDPVQKNTSLFVQRRINNKFSVLEIILSDEEEEVKPAVEKKQEPTTTAVLFTSPVNSWAGRVAAGIKSKEEPPAVPVTAEPAVTKEEVIESCNTYIPQNTSWFDAEL